jgi:hypothetical protein
MPDDLVLVLKKQADMIERRRLETLLFCPDPWALRHRFVNVATGETIRARCNSWRCLYCGPRKVDQWRQLVKEAEPVLFLTLTKAGHTVSESARALTTFLQYVRRGAKGRGSSHVGARSAYPAEYFAVLERHQDFEHVGFHWHLLLNGVDHIPHSVLKEGWRSATHGTSYIVHVQAIRKPQVIGYVTKYLMKSLSDEEKGVSLVERERFVYRLDENGKPLKQRTKQKVQVVSSARRIRYSRNFFPLSVEDLRARLFNREEGLVADDTVSHGKPEEEEEGESPPSSWVLYSHEETTDDITALGERRRQALLESLEAVRAGSLHLSRRVINMWAYQRNGKG